MKTLTYPPRFSIQDDENPCEKEIHARSSSRIYSRSTMAYSLITIIGGALLIAAAPLIAMGEGMTLWLWGILSGVGCTAGIFVHIWRGAKDEKARRETAWRSIWGIAGGLGIPRVVLLTWPWVAHVAILNDPYILVVGAFLCFMLCSYACLGWMRWLEKDAPKMGYRQGKGLERKSDQYVQPTDEIDP